MRNHGFVCVNVLTDFIIIQNETMCENSIELLFNLISYPLSNAVLFSE